MRLVIGKGSSVHVFSVGRITEVTATIAGDRACLYIAEEIDSLSSRGSRSVCFEWEDSGLVTHGDGVMLTMREVCEKCDNPWCLGECPAK